MVDWEGGEKDGAGVGVGVGVGKLTLGVNKVKVVTALGGMGVYYARLRSPYRHSGVKFIDVCGDATLNGFMANGLSLWFTVKSRKC